MIIVRIYQALSEVSVEASASVSRSPVGMPQEPVFVFLGREYLDGTHDLNPEDLSEALYRVLERAHRGIGEEFGGLSMVC